MKRRAPLARKAPLLRRTRLRPRSQREIRASRSAATRIRPQPEQDLAHMGRVKRMRCLCCAKLNLQQQSPTEAHHIRRDLATGRKLGKDQRAPDRHTLPLCALHHREGRKGEAFHKGSRTWESLFGNEIDLLDEVLAILGCGGTLPASA